MYLIICFPVGLAVYGSVNLLLMVPQGIRSLYICYVTNTHKFVKNVVHLLVNKLKWFF